MKAENGVLIDIHVPFAIRNDETVSLLLPLLRCVRASPVNISSRGSSSSWKATRFDANASAWMLYLYRGETHFTFYAIETLEGAINSLHTYVNILVAILTGKTRVEVG
jgi:hypothetical protein